MGSIVAIKLSWRFRCPPPTLRVDGRGAATKARDSRLRRNRRGLSWKNLKSIGNIRERCLAVIAADGGLMKY